MTTEPRTITAGDSISWTRSLPDYLPGDGWVLSYRLVSATASYSIATSASGDEHLASIDATTSATYAPNQYQLVAQVSNGPSRVTLERTRVAVLADPASAGYDPRSHAEKVLEAIEVALQTKATKDVHNITVEGQTIGRYTWAELVEVEKYYRGRVNRQRRREREKRTGRPSNRVLARLR